MSYKLTREEVDFFLSFQFLEDEDYINDNIRNISHTGNNIKNTNLQYFLEKLELILKEQISHLIDSQNTEEVGVFISGGVDSFLLLFYIRMLFPNLIIYTFTFFPCKPKDQELLELHNLTNRFRTIHKNIYKEVGFQDIINNLKFIYSKTMKLIGDEGFLYNSIFIRELIKETHINTFISGDGMDVLFGGLSMYRLSYIEQLTHASRKLESSIFRDKYEEKYFYDNCESYEKDFFYKYGEYFGGDFIGTNHENIRRKFYKYFEVFNHEQNSPIMKMIRFTLVFLVGNRKEFIYESGNISGVTILTPFIEKPFVEKILNLGIPDELLVDNSNTKILIRKLAEKVMAENDIVFNFLETLKIDYLGEFNKGSKYIIYISWFLFTNNYITKKHYDLVPFFIKNAMWYENKIRIYLLLNLYCFITFHNSSL